MSNETSRGGPRVSATIIAFDGLIADTIDMRAASLESALQHVANPHTMPTPSAIAESLRGRTFAESAQALGQSDETTVDLVALDANRRYAERIAQGVSLVPGAREYIAGLAREGRVVGRADSTRQQVNAIVSLSDLEYAFTFIRCSDDHPQLRNSTSAASSRAAINARLSALEIPEANRTFQELPSLK